MRSRVFFLCLPLLLALAGPASARGGGTLDSLLPGIRAAHPGRLSDAEPFTASDGSTHYRIKWMTPEGRILYFDADARTGRYLNSGGDDGGQWRGGGGRRGRGGDSDGGDGSERPPRNHWNGDGDWYPGEGGDWRGGGRHDDGGDWRGRRGGDWSGGRGGDWRGGHGRGGGHHH